MGKSYKDLIVWQKSYTLCTEVYNVTKLLPKDEQFGLTSQIRRCAVSIPSNIAEGQQRNNKREFVQFLGIAKGSLAELETQLSLANDIYGLEVTAHLTLANEIQRMLNTLVKNIRQE